MSTTAISAKDVSELRQRTGAGMMDCKKALEEAGGNMEKAAELLQARGIAKAEKRAGRTVAAGIVYSYIHHNAQVGVLLEINCETDFVARTEDFKALAHEVALHIASHDPSPVAVTPADIPADLVERQRRIAEQQVVEEGKPENIRPKIVEGKVKKFISDRSLTEQTFVKDAEKTVGQLIKEASGKLGEAVTVRRFSRFQIGEA